MRACPYVVIVSIMCRTFITRECTEYFTTRPKREMVVLGNKPWIILDQDEENDCRFSPVGRILGAYSMYMVHNCQEKVTEVIL